jgi:hypothetical protein
MSLTGFNRERRLKKKQEQDNQLETEKTQPIIEPIKQKTTKK